MRISNRSNKYGSGDKHTFDNDYDYLLFRQDWSGNESVHFNKDEIENVLNKIDAGDIAIHSNYSILYCANEELMKFVEDMFGCYTLVKE